MFKPVLVLHTILTFLLLFSRRNLLRQTIKMDSNFGLSLSALKTLQTTCSRASTYDQSGETGQKRFS